MSWISSLLGMDLLIQKVHNGNGSVLRELELIREEQQLLRKMCSTLFEKIIDLEHNVSNDHKRSVDWMAAHLSNTSVYGSQPQLVNHNINNVKGQINRDNVVAIDRAVQVRDMLTQATGSEDAYNHAMDRLIQETAALLTQQEEDNIQ